MDLTELPEIQDGPFKPDWESLKGYKCPDWFRDAKFGIWTHWGPQSVPRYGDWYARNMYLEGHTSYEYHLKHYGHPSQFGYKDIIKLWKAQDFDPDNLMARFSATGAKYFMALGCHHDNFDCWNSSYLEWNSLNYGPHKDIVGLWKQAALKFGLRFGVSEHLERSYSWFNTNKGHDIKGPFAGVPYDGNDPAYSNLYFEPHPDTTEGYPRNPSRQFVNNFYQRIKDLVDKYQPDLLYTDGGIPFGVVGRAMVANFYNTNMNSHQGQLEAVYLLKDINHIFPQLNHGDYQDNVGVLDLERGVADGIRQGPWQTDTCIGNWFYQDNISYKSAEYVVHMLVDVVSKNGNLLLNIPLQPEGTMDQETLKIVDELGAWMSINGEGIYGTRPWKVFGEGTTLTRSGDYQEAQTYFNPSDFRFTQKENAVFAFFMAWPQNDKLNIKGLAAREGTGKVGGVELLGHKRQLEWQQLDDSLEVNLPADKPCRNAWTLKITLA